MVKAEDSWLFQQHSDWDSIHLNYMSRLLPPGKQQNASSCMNPCTFSTNVAFPRISVSGLPGVEISDENGAYGLTYGLPPLIESSHPPTNPCPEGPPCAFFRKPQCKTISRDETGSIQKRFLIFDQSGCHTRFYLSQFGSSQNPIIPPMKPVHVYHEQLPKLEQLSPIKCKSEGASDDNQIVGEGSEYHEDTEEINALLYSDDDDEYDFDDDKDGEVTSMDHSPFATKVSLENYEQVGEITEEVATSDGPTKRQRLLDGGYNKSLFVDATRSVRSDRSCENNDVESICGHSRTKVKVQGSNLCAKRLRTEKIHKTLGVLENIIPGSKSKEPLLIIDEAINYLKFLKLKAEALGLKKQ